MQELKLHILAASVMLGQEIDHGHHINNSVTDNGKKPVHTVFNKICSITGCLVESARVDVTYSRCVCDVGTGN